LVHAHGGDRTGGRAGNHRWHFGICREILDRFNWPRIYST
jgi:hypothetical protein